MRAEKKYSFCIQTPIKKNLGASYEITQTTQTNHISLNQGTPTATLRSPVFVSCKKNKGKVVLTGKPPFRVEPVIDRLHYTTQPPSLSFPLPPGCLFLCSNILGIPLGGGVLSMPRKARSFTIFQLRGLRIYVICVVWQNKMERFQNKKKEKWMQSKVP